MLAVFETSMGLAAFFSSISSSVESIVLSLLLVYLCYRAAKNFRHYRQIAESTPEVPKSPVTHLPAWKDASKIFPWLSLAMGGVALSAMLALLAGAVFESTQISALSADPATWEQIYAT